MQSLLTGYRMLTVWQPWADFLTADEAVVESVRQQNPELAELLPKDVENRGYGTTWRGTILVHAGQNVDLLACDRFGLDPAGFTRGAVVGTVRLFDVVTDSPSYWAETGSKHWRAVDRKRLDVAVPCRGFQGACTAPPAVLAAVLSRLEHQRQRATT